MQTYRHISDPAHGWIEVPIAELAKHHIEHKISRYSYMGKGNAYLEEDCDAALFIKKLREAETPFEIKEVYQKRTFIRNLPRYEFGV